jgi:hypothetical protein
MKMKFDNPNFKTQPIRLVLFMTIWLSEMALITKFRLVHNLQEFSDRYQFPPGISFLQTPIYQDQTSVGQFFDFGPNLCWRSYHI